MIPAERAHLKASAITNPGMSGKNNEDRYAVAAFRTEGERPVPVLFAIVSDGIGGHRAGEVAAEMVVETVSQAVAQSNASNPVQTLRESVMRSSQEILVQAESSPEKKGMGATCACALVVGDRLYIAYVGDSRLYLIRNGNIQQLSIDHTWVQEAVDAGVIDPGQTKEHPNAHVIRRYLGSKHPVEPDTRLRLAVNEEDSRSEGNQGLHLRPNDHVLLCSDGLTDLVQDHEILAIMQASDPEKAIKKLVELANKRGGHDNITIVDLRVPDLLPDATQPVSLSASLDKKKRPTWLILLIGLTILMILILAAGGAYLFLWRPDGSQATATASIQPGGTQPAISPSLDSTSAGETPTAEVISTPLETPGADLQPAPGTPKPTLTPWPTNTVAP